MNIRRTISRLLRRNESENYIKRMRKCGVSIGEGTRIFDPTTTLIDTQNPHMLSIGKNVRITKGCIVLTHDYSWSVLAGVYGEILGGVGKVEIGNNVFIGMNSIILKDTSIGDNVIIGAGSVIKGKIESDSVYAGNPAKRIMSLDEFYEKRKAKQLVELDEIKRQYKIRYGKDADEKATIEYFWQYWERSRPLSKDVEGLIERTGYAEKIRKKFYDLD